MQYFQEIIFKLKQYWAERGCIIQEPYDVEVGAGTMCPETFLRVLGPKPHRVAYVQPSRHSMRFRSEEHTSELQSQSNLVCRLLLEKKKKNNYQNVPIAEKTHADCKLCAPQHL